MCTFDSALDACRQAPEDEPINWQALLEMALETPDQHRRKTAQPSHVKSFTELSRLALETGKGKELLAELIEARKHTPYINRSDHAFADLFVSMHKYDLDHISDWHGAISCWYQQRLQHFIERKNYKRAFDTLVEAARALCRVQGDLRDAYTKPWDPWDMSCPSAINGAYAWRMRQIMHDPALLDFIEMVWEAHHKAGLVPKPSLNQQAWENTCRPFTFSFGKNAGGNKPQIQENTGSLPMSWLWAAFAQTGDVTPWYCPIFRAEKGHYYEAGRPGPIWYPVRASGSKLRLLIRHHAQIKRRKKLQRFCDKHGLEMPSE